MADKSCGWSGDVWTCYGGCGISTVSTCTPWFWLLGWDFSCWQQYNRMLAVMTMNVGYFMSVLAGVWLGTFILGSVAADSRWMHCWTWVSGHWRINLFISEWGFRHAPREAYNTYHVALHLAGPLALLFSRGLAMLRSLYEWFYVFK